MARKWMVPRVKYYKSKKSTGKCACCGKTIPDNLAFSYVDENNYAITRNAPYYCWRCYNEKYKNDQISFLQLLRAAKLNPEIDAVNKLIIINNKEYTFNQKEEILKEYNL